MPKKLSPSATGIFRASHRRIWIMLAVFLVAVFLFGAIAQEIIEASKGEQAAAQLFDDRILQFFAEHRAPLLNRVMIDITALGSVSVILVLALFVGSLLFSLGDRVGILHLVVVLAGAGVLPTIMKGIFGRERPSLVDHLVEVKDPSVPSGHSLGAAAVYLTLAFFASRHRRHLGFEFFFLALAAVVIGLVGLSRMYLGVHYPTDVFAGFCAGSAWALLVASAFHPLYRRTREG